jgi:hypothetical protein
MTQSQNRKMTDGTEHLGFAQLSHLTVELMARKLELNLSTVKRDGYLAGISGRFQISCGRDVAVLAGVCFKGPESKFQMICDRQFSKFE